MIPRPDPIETPKGAFPPIPPTDGPKEPGQKTPFKPGKGMRAHASQRVKPKDEDEEAEIARIKQELQEFFREQHLGPDSLDPSDWVPSGPISYRHLQGALADQTVTFADAARFTLRCEGEDVELRVESDTIAQLPTAQGGQPLHVIVQDYCGMHIAKAVCTEEFYLLFDAIETINDKLPAMKHYLRLTPAQQGEILHQRLGKKYPRVDNSLRGAFKKRDELRLKYDICRDTYPPQLQRAIEDLFAQPSAKGKTDHKLEYILNISTTARHRKEVSGKELRAALDKHIYRMDAVKEKLVECLVASHYTNQRGLRILLVGSPGTGKTSLARAVAEAYGLPFNVIPLNSVISSIDLKGLDSSFDSADAGKFVKAFYELGTTEAVIVLDELDKMGRGYKDGNPADSILDALSDEYMCADAFLEVSVDTGNTIFIATANSTQNIPSYLLNRFDVIHIDDYEDEDKLVIAQNYIIPQLLAQYGIGADELSFRPEALTAIVRDYCSDQGARMLKENVKALVRRALNLWEEAGIRKPLEIDPAFVQGVLEPFADENDLSLRFVRNRDKFAPDVREEIKKTLAGLTALEQEPQMREKDTRRVEYLTSLIPDHTGFEHFDTAAFFAGVNSSHFGLTDVKERIAKSFHTKAIQKRSFSSERLLLVGGAGTGKTSVCESIARGLGIPFVRVSLNGVCDENAIKGFSPTYVSADAGEIVKGLARVKTTRALVMLDEVDKMGSWHGIKASSALFDLLDNSAKFTDRFLVVPIDLSNVLFIATANDVSHIEPWLLDRFQIIELDGYTDRDKERILLDYLLPKLEGEYEAGGVKLSITDGAVQALIHEYCTSFGVRDLEKALRQMVSDALYRAPERRELILDLADVTATLGAKPLPRGNLPKKAVPGFAKALAVTGGNCGMAFSIETCVIPGESATCITGLPKESAIDSVKLAKTYIRLHYLSDRSDFGLHLHFGEGAVVKDGPSAGVSILMSMLSAVFQTPVAEDAAFTGEIDLFGNVFAIGGVAAKLQAAQRAGCKRVFIPWDNYAQLSPDDLARHAVEVIPARHVSQVIDAVLPALAGRGCALPLAR